MVHVYTLDYVLSVVLKLKFVCTIMFRMCPPCMCLTNDAWITDNAFSSMLSVWLSIPLPPQVWNYKQKRCIFTLLGHLDYIRTTFFHKVMSDAYWWGLVLLVMCPAQWVTVHNRVMCCIDSLVNNPAVLSQLSLVSVWHYRYLQLSLIPPCLIF